MYSTLLYASIRKPECDENEIKKILNSARKNNPKMDITGVLLYNQKKFLQYLEGDYETIKSLYGDIKKDERHKNVILVSLSKDFLDRRVFPSWAMGEKDLNDNSYNFEAIDNSTKELFEKAINGEELSASKTLSLVKTIMS